VREGKGKFPDVFRMTAFILESYPTGTNGKLCVHGCLVAPLYGKWNPNIIQTVHLEKRGKKKILPEVSQFVYPPKPFFKLWQNIIFN